jgi:hypothetical protein
LLGNLALHHNKQLVGIHVPGHPNAVVVGGLDYFGQTRSHPLE